MVNRRKFNTIYIWRIVFTFCIATLHLFNVFPNYYKRWNFRNGLYIGVEFFLIVAGYLLATAFDKDKEITPLSYWIKRLKKLYPYYIGAFIVSLTWAFYANPNIYNFELKSTNLFLSILEALFLQTGIGYPDKVFNANCWYVSAFLIGSYIVYYLLKNWKDHFVNMVAPLSVLLIYGYFYRMNGTIAVYRDSSLLIVNDGLLRAFAGLSLGVICYYLSQKIKNVKKTKTVEIILAILEFVGYSFVIFMSLYNMVPKNDFIFIAILAICIILSFTNKLYENVSCAKFLIKMNDLCYVIYLTHNVIRLYLFPELFPSHNESLKVLLLYYFVIVIYAVIFKKIVDVLSYKIQCKKQ